MGWLEERFINQYNLDNLPRIKYPSHKYIHGKRLHKTPYGYLPGVTTVLGQTKPAGAKVALDRWKKQNPEEGKRVLARGRALDAYVGKYWSGLELMNDSIGGVATLTGQDELNQQQNQFLSVLAPLAIEYPMASIKGFAGSPDAIALVQNQPPKDYPLALNQGDVVLIDFKTSTKKKTDSYVTDYFLQLGAYSQLIKENFNFEIKRACIAMSCEATGYPLFWLLNQDDIAERRDQFFERLQEYNAEYSDGF
jgi:hypothetical protein